MQITAQMVKELREKTGIAMMECKKALTECGGDMEKAVDYLRKRGLATAEKKAGRATTEGLIGSYIHSNGKIGVMVEVSCETDFVARNDKFKEFVRDIAMHIAASNVLVVNRDEIDPALIEKEKSIYIEQMKNEKKPENIIEKIVKGKIDKFCSEITLTEQKFIKNPDLTIKDYTSGKIAEIGENIIIQRFTKYTLGESA